MRGGEYSVIKEGFDMKYEDMRRRGDEEVY